MRILNRYIAHEIFASTVLVFMALLMLFAFFDLIHELGNIGNGSYRLTFILLFVALNVPGHIYELFPIAALIGTLFALAQLVSHSEYTVMRVSGASVKQISIALLRAGLVFVLLTFIFGEFIVPSSQRTAEQLRLKAMNTVIAQEFRSGLWVKDEKSFVNVKEILPDTTLLGVKIYEFDQDHHLRTISFAQHGSYENENRWRLKDVVQTRFEASRTAVSTIPEAVWHSVLNPDILNVLLVVPEKMSAWNLYQYTNHLAENKQRTSRYEIALWTKLFYPLAVLVMMLLALPFAYYQKRAGGVGAKIFAGIMLGLGFDLLNTLFSHLGLLYEWPPLFSAIFPTLIFFTMAVSLTWWIERR